MFDYLCLVAEKKYWKVQTTEFGILIFHFFFFFRNATGSCESGEMENSAAHELPEVGSLPDGFVDSSTEPLAPPTPNWEHEKLPLDYKDYNFSELDRSNESGYEGEEVKFQLCKGEAEKTKKPRTFPVPLSEEDGSDDAVEHLDEAAVTPISSNLVSKASVGSSGRSEVKEDVQEKCQNSETTVQGGPDSQPVHMKNTSLSESIDSLQNRKQERSETKRKNSKRTFKSDKEFLELTLKYQQVLAERDSAISVRDKLESLCRELQRQNNMLMEECERASTEGQNLRLDLLARFQDSIKDLSNKLEEQKDESLAQLRQNEILRTKLKRLVDLNTLSEQQHEQQLKQKTLELEIADLKIKQHEEKLVQEQSKMKLFEEQVSQLEATEKKLRLQLTEDGEKFQDASLKMAKSLMELTKENMFLKSKSEKSDFTLVQLVEERERMKTHLEKIKKQKEKLESLCRSLEAERKVIRNGNKGCASVLPSL